MQHLQEEDGDNSSQRALQSSFSGRRDGFLKDFPGISQVPRILAEHSLKGIFLAVLFLSLLNLFLFLRHTSHDYNSLQAQHSQSNSEFAAKFDNTERILQKMIQKMEQQEEKFQRVQNETETKLTLSEEKNRLLTLKLESLFNETNTIKNSLGSSKQTVNRMVNNMIGQLMTVDSFAKTNLSQSIKANRLKVDELRLQLESVGLSTTNHTGVGERLELRQELWREGRASMVLSREIFQEQLENSSQALKSLLQTFKTSPGAGKFNLADNKILFDLLYNSTTSENICGGSFNMSEPSLFRYEKPLDATENSRICIWVMWTVESVAMKVRLLDLSGEVTIYQNINSQDSHASGIHKWTTSDLLTEIDISSNIAVVVFTPASLSPNSSTLFDPSSPKDVMEIGFRFFDPSPVTADVRVDILNATVSTTVTLDKRGGHEHNQRSYTFIYPPAGRKVQVDVLSVNMEQGPDFLLVFKYSNQTQQFEFARRLTGILISRATFVGYTDQPVLLYFHTDVSIISEGYRATYSSTT